MTRKDLIVLALALAALTGCKSEKTDESEASVLRSVKTQIVQREPVSLLRRFPAVLEPPQLVPLAFEVSGRIAEVDLRVGQRVRAGEVLAIIEPLDLELRLEQAQASVLDARTGAENAQSEASRQEQLFERGVTTAARRDTAVSQAQQARARLSQAEANLALLQESRSDAELKAPFDGVINSVDIQDFASVQAGRPVVSLYQEGRLQASVLVSFEVVQGLSTGDIVEVVPADQGLAPLQGVITEIGRRAPAVSSFPVIVTLENTVDDLRSGMAVDVQIDLEVTQGAGLISVPLTAIDTNRSGPFEGRPPFPAQVYVFVPGTEETGRLESRNIEIIASAEDQLFLQSGLSEGEQVVTAGVPFLRDGMEVTQYQPQQGGAD